MGTFGLHCPLSLPPHACHGIHNITFSAFSILPTQCTCIYSLPGFFFFSTDKYLTFHIHSPNSKIINLRVVFSFSFFILFLLLSRSQNFSQYPWNFVSSQRFKPILVWLLKPNCSSAADWERNRLKIHWISFCMLLYLLFLELPGINIHILVTKTNIDCKVHVCLTYSTCINCKNWRLWAFCCLLHYPSQDKEVNMMKSRLEGLISECVSHSFFYH